MRSDRSRQLPVMIFGIADGIDVAWPGRNAFPQGPSHEIDNRVGVTFFR